VLGRLRAELIMKDMEVESYKKILYHRRPGNTQA